MIQALALIILGLTEIAAWITHIIWAFGILLSDQTAPIGKLILAVFGTIIPIIGSVHGVLIWFGIGG